jgi:hypothetical protein
MASIRAFSKIAETAESAWSVFLPLRIPDIVGAAKLMRSIIMLMTIMSSTSVNAEAGDELRRQGRMPRGRAWRPPAGFRAREDGDPVGFMGAR